MPENQQARHPAKCDAKYCAAAIAAVGYSAHTFVAHIDLPDVAFARK